MQRTTHLAIILRHRFPDLSFSGLADRHDHGGTLSGFSQMTSSTVASVRPPFDYTASQRHGLGGARATKIAKPHLSPMFA
ncbi:hypothetical protein AC578_8382 [Pseudocercospora eumusae]|uniref:Uncharacterized protein n=1 Tax=Pseudocercospora eumusae TaxID=321146 RepID=A0A139HS48_9PEZI|nr:hypothetical protein AC578_8382 [Pseudocercospora eumusae]